MAKANGDKLTSSQMKNAINKNWGIYANLKNAGGSFWNGRTPQESWTEAYNHMKANA